MRWAVACALGTLSLGAVAETIDEVVVKGQADIDELSPEQDYRFYGRWSEYTNKRSGKPEIQFHFQSFVKQAPHNRAGVVSYLCDAGEGHGLGKVRANKLSDLYGSDAVKTLRQQPGKVAEDLAAHRQPCDAQSRAQIEQAEDHAVEAAVGDIAEIALDQKREHVEFRAGCSSTRNPYDLARCRRGRTSRFRQRADGRR